MNEIRFLWMRTYLMTQVEGQIVSGNLVYGPLNFFVCSRPSSQKEREKKTKRKSNVNKSY